MKIPKFTLLSVLLLCVAVALPPLEAAEIPSPPEAESEFYRDTEFSIDAFGEIKTPDLDKERSAVGFGANFFLTRNFGLGASTSLEDLRGSAIDTVRLKGLFRAPVGRYAFGAYGGAERQLKAGEWSLILGPSFEVRATPNIGWVTEIGANKRLTGDREITAEARTGLRVSF